MPSKIPLEVRFRALFEHGVTFEFTLDTWDEGDEYPEARLARARDFLVTDVRCGVPIYVVKNGVPDRPLILGEDARLIALYEVAVTTDED